MSKLFKTSVELLCQSKPIEALAKLSLSCRLASSICPLLARSGLGCDQWLEDHPGLVKLFLYPLIPRYCSHSGDECWGFDEKNKSHAYTSTSVFISMARLIFTNPTLFMYRLRGVRLSILLSAPRQHRCQKCQPQPSF